MANLSCPIGGIYIMENPFLTTKLCSVFRGSRARGVALNMGVASIERVDVSLVVAPCRDVLSRYSPVSLVVMRSLV